MYELIDHTADVGLRIHAKTLAAALAEAGRGFSSLIVENLDDVRTAETVRIELPLADRTAGSLDYLLFDWLAALLQEFETHGRVFSRFDVQELPLGIVADCAGEPIDPARHRLCHEIKAVTYHQLEFRPTDDGYAGQVILDV
ncbi:MAG: archease [Planctomycetaceae bacterium]|nr:archease [Planctomycetaceae bacterium]